MSDDTTPTPLSMQAAQRIMTPSSMAAVSVPMSLEERIEAIESYINGLKVERPQLLAELRAEIASIKTAIADERTKRADLETRVTELVTKVDSLTAEMAAQTSMLKIIVKAVDTPRVRQLGLAALTSLTIILGAIAAWMAARTNAPPPTPTPPAVVTVYVPTSAPKGSPNE